MEKVLYKKKYKPSKYLENINKIKLTVDVDPVNFG